MAKKQSRTVSANEDHCCDRRCCDSACTCRGSNLLDGCRVEAVVSVDRRGQLVLPKDVREKAGFHPDQKLAIVSWMKGKDLCCLTLQRADDLAEVVRRTYGPLLSSAIR